MSQPQCYDDDYCRTAQLWQETGESDMQRRAAGTNLSDHANDVDTVHRSRRDGTADIPVIRTIIATCLEEISMEYINLYG